MEYLSLLLSFFGALISGNQARKSKKHANEAERFWKYIKSKRLAVEMSSLLTETKSISTILRKYGPNAPPSSLKGIDPSDDAAKIQSFCSILAEHRDSFSDNGTNIADALYEMLSEKLLNFQQGVPEDEVKESGSSMLKGVDRFVPEVKYRSEGSMDGSI